MEPSPAPLPRSDITGLVLCGGQSLRMGGVAKGMMELHGRPLVAHVIERLRPQVGPLLLNANRPEYGGLGLPVIGDMIGGFPGPLAGLHAGLLACATPWLVTAPCDAPALPHDLVTRLAQTPYPQPDISYPLRKTPSRQRRLFVACSPSGIEPGFILCHASLARDLEAWLKNGGRKVQDWLHSSGAIEVRFDNATAFANVNTPEELAGLNAAQSPSV